MTIDLSGDREQAVRSLMEAGRYASEGDVIDDALRLLEQRYRSASVGTGVPDDPTARQREALRRVCDRLDAMPTTAVADGLTNRDHDRILYGSRP